MLGFGARTATTLVLSVGLAAVTLGACTPTDRNFSSGGGSGGNNSCVADTQEACYSGPEGTLEIGLCRAGVHVCLQDGSGFGECGGEVVPQAENCLTLDDEGCDGPNPVECPTLGHGWSKSFGGMNEDVISAIAIDPANGDIVATGYFPDTIDFGGGPLPSTGSTDFFVARFDALGNHLWSKRFGDMQSQTGNDIAVDAQGRIYVVGEMQGSIDFGDGVPVTSKGDLDAFVASFDAQGNYLWSRLFGDALRQEANAVAVTPSGQIVVAGNFSGFIQLQGQELPSQGEDIFVIKLEPTGTDAGARRFGGQLTEELYSLTVDSQGAVLIAGSHESALDFGPAGMLPNQGGYDAFIAKLSPSLVEMWAQSWGDPSFQRAHTIVTAPNNDVFVMGDFNGSFSLPGGTVHTSGPNERSMYIYAATTDGVERWSRSTGKATSPFAREALAVDPSSQSIIATGFFDGELDFGGGPLIANVVDGFVAKISWDGAHIASKNYGGPALDALFDVAVGPNGEIFVSGGHQGPADFGGGTLPAPAQDDIQALLMRLLP